MPRGLRKNVAREKGSTLDQVDVSIRIAESDRSSIADALSQLLADSYTLYLKTHNYHWNVTGAPTSAPARTV